MPDNAEMVENVEDKDILVRSTQPGRTMDLYYRTDDMFSSPQLYYAFSPDGQKVALSTALVPTFDTQQSLQL